MAAAPTVAALGAGPTVSHRQRAPQLNLFDIPELMPGTKPRCNPSQREDFERRCRHLYEQHTHEVCVPPTRADTGVGATAAVEEMQAMFPTIDSALVQMLYAEAPTPQHALDTLLALTTATAEPVAGGERPASPPSRNLGVDDHDKFPSLVTSDGWQVFNQRGFNREDEELGSVWRDRAQVATNLPAPQTKQVAPSTAWASARHRRSREKKNAVEDGIMPETDYELRQRIGQQRAKNRAQYGRGGASGRGAKGYAVGHGGACRSDDGSSDDEASEDDQEK